MKPFLAFITVAALGSAALFEWQQAWQAGFKAAQSTIVQEANLNANRAALDEAELRVLKKADSVAERLPAAAPSRAAPANGATQANLGATPPTTRANAPSVASDTSHDQAFFSISQDNLHRYWCTPTPVTVPTQKGGLCVYRGACFYCDVEDAEMELPPNPDVWCARHVGEKTIRMRAVQENANCCPNEGHGDAIECPDLRTCFEDATNKCAGD